MPRKSTLLIALTLVVSASHPLFAQNQGIEGRWTNGGNCDKWVSFTRSGSSWTYAEGRLDKGQSRGASVSTAAGGKVTVRIPTDDYEYVIQMNGAGSFTAVEGFTKGPMAGQRRTYTYKRCS
jgi:hypothetical protein